MPDRSISKTRMKKLFERQSDVARARVIKVFGDFESAYAADMRISRGVMSFDSGMAFGDTFFSRAGDRWYPLNEYER